MTDGSATLLRHCQPASELEYLAWLLGYLSKGGKVTHEYRYKFPAFRWVVLCERPDVIPVLYGSDARAVIMPARVDLTPDDIPRTTNGRCGHSTFYFMRGRAQVGGWVPLYAGLIPEELMT